MNKENLYTTCFHAGLNALDKKHFRLKVHCIPEKTRPAIIGMLRIYLE